MCQCAAPRPISLLFFFNDTATTEIYTLSLHDALPIPPSTPTPSDTASSTRSRRRTAPSTRSEEHTSELQSLRHLVCRLLLEKKKNAAQQQKSTAADKSATASHHQNRTRPDSITKHTKQ